MSILFKHFLNSLEVSLGVKKKNKGNIFSFLKTWYIRFFFAFPKVRNLIKEKLKEDYIEKNLFKKDCSTNEVLKSISDLGFYNNLIITSENLNNIKNDILFKNTIFAFKGEKENSTNFYNNLTPNDNINKIISKSKNYKISHVGLELDLNQTKAIKQFACSKFFLEIAKSYLNSDDLTISGQCYISNPFEISEREKKDNAQYFHYDLEFKKFFKVFIYLNNVDEFTGPHSFVKKSHRQKSFKHILAERIDIEEVKRIYKSDGIKKFTGPEGSTIIEDTFGLHKGEVPQQDTRSMLILIYGLGEGIKDYSSFIRP